MDVSELRKRILHALDAARKDAVTRRTEVDEASRAYEQFLENIAAPLLKQAQAVLRAEQQLFTVHTPAGSIRLVSDSAPQTFVEFVLEVSPRVPQVIGRVSLTRGRQGVVVEERPLAPGKPVAELVEDDVAQFLVTEIPKLIVRS
jgi:hypothetical protein